jgi:hypothetical protein
MHGLVKKRIFAGVDEKKVGRNLLSRSRIMPSNVPEGRR